MKLVDISRDLSACVDAISTRGAAEYTYNPLSYAREPHERYLRKYGRGRKQVLLVGMNPGPFGMAQTGVPFGDVVMVRDWMKIEGKVERPERTHDKRPIEGFECARREVSGSRLWSFARDKFGSPEAFFQDFFVINYCPLVFMETSGKNLTPDKLPSPLKKQLFHACDEALVAAYRLLQPQWVLGVGAFARGRIEDALGQEQVKVGQILHPSPASPAANRGWAEAAEKQLQELGIALP
jgi:single-strand selective monofunctional uracil DNA glycosylase